MGRVKIAIMISGRGSNMEVILRQAMEGILRDCCEVALVFANRADAAGLETARAAGVPTASIESRGRKRRRFDREVLELLEGYRPDYLVLAGYMRILSDLFVEAYRGRIINIHPADTARFQGVGGYDWAFDNKLNETKISVHYVDEGVDTGPVIAQEVVDLTGADSLSEVERRGLAVEHRFYSEVLRQLFSHQRQ